MTYSPDVTLRDALGVYFEENGFGSDGGYADAWVDFKLGSLPCPFPNTDARKRAVRYHDLHHILTEYRTDIVGEFEISAWEIASGCRDFFAAWQLNLGGLFAGLFVAPQRTFRAFVRGRRMNNFYGQDYEALLQLTVARARDEVSGAEPPKAATPGDVAWFSVAAVAGAVVGITTLMVFLPMALVAAPILNVAAGRAARRRQERGRDSAALIASAVARTTGITAG